MIVGGELLVRPPWVGVFYHLCVRCLSSFPFSALKFSLERFNYSSTCERPADRLLTYWLHRAASISQHQRAQRFTAAVLCTARAQSTGYLVKEPNSSQTDSCPSTMRANRTAASRMDTPTRPRCGVSPPHGNCTRQPQLWTPILNRSFVICRPRELFQIPACQPGRRRANKIGPRPRARTAGQTSHEIVGGAWPSAPAAVGPSFSSETHADAHSAWHPIRLLQPTGASSSTPCSDCVGKARRDGTSEHPGGRGVFSPLAERRL